MSKEEVTDLVRFLAPFPEYVREMALWLRAFIWDLYPDSNELIYDNYNAVAVGFSLTEKAGDVFCSIAVYSKHVNFGFNRGAEIADPQKIFSGTGSLYRHLTLKGTSDFPQQYIRALLGEAYQNAIERLHQKETPPRGKTIIKSISAKQKRPR